MNKVLFRSIIVAAILTLVSCAKEDTEPQDPGTDPAPANNSEFKWTINGVTTTADSAVCYTQFTTLFAYRNGTITTVEINLADIVPATYIINSTTGNELKYVSTNANLSAGSGTVTISSATGNKLNGTFEAKFNNASISAMSGQFTNVKMR